MNHHCGGFNSRGALGGEINHETSNKAATAAIDGNPHIDKRRNLHDGSEEHEHKRNGFQMSWDVKTRLISDASFHSRKVGFLVVSGGAT